jgi:type II secretory pathway component PulF
MALFKFKIADAGGKVCETVIEGDHQDDAVSRLRNRGMHPLKFLGETNSQRVSSDSGGFLGRDGFNVYEFTDSSRRVGIYRFYFAFRPDICGYEA